MTVCVPDWIPNRLLTVNEVAEVCHLSGRQIRRLIADSRLPVVRLGRAVRIRPEAAAALLEPALIKSTITIQ